MRPHPVRRALLLLLATCLTPACAGGVRHRPEALNYWRPGARTARFPATAVTGATAPAGSPSTADGAGAPADPAGVPAAAGTAVPAAPAPSPATAAARPAAATATPARAELRTVATGPSGPAGTITPAPGSTATSGPPAPGTAGGSRSGGGPVPAPGPAPAPAPGGGTTIGVTKDAVTLGIFYPRTGFYTGIFRNVPVVTQAAVDEAGLINGRRLVIKYYDDGSENPSTIQLEEKRAKDEALTYASLVSESNAILAPLADQHKIPLVVGNMDEKLAESLTYAFPVYGYWARMATVLPGFIKNVLGAGAKKIGVVYEGTSTATDAKNAFKAKAREAGLAVVYEQPIAVNQSTCANEVANLQSHGAEVVFMMNGPLGAICMLRDAKALGYRPTWTGVGVSWALNLVAAASGGSADGIRFLSTTTTLDTPAGQRYSEMMRRAAPDSGAADDDALLLWYSFIRSAIEGLRRAGPDLSREGLLRTWETKMTGYDSGYLPPPTFGPGNRSGPLAFGVTACCTNGRWTTPGPGWRPVY